MPLHCTLHTQNFKEATINIEYSIELFEKNNELLKSGKAKELLNLLTHFSVEIQRQNKKGQYPIEIKSWFERNKEKFKKK